MKSHINYYDEVFWVTRQIPHGRVTSYGAIADYLALGSARMVGWALNKCNLTGNWDVPAHRVVNRKGELSGRNHFSTPSLMEQLLTNEGVPVTDHKISNFAQYFWHPGDHLPDRDG